MGLYSPSRNLKVCIHMMKIVPERNGRKIKKVESCSSNNYTSRKVSTELCPEFFPRSIWWCNFLFPLYASSELTNNIIVLTFEVGLEIPTVWGYTICGLRVNFDSGQKISDETNDIIKSLTDSTHSIHTWFGIFPFICINQIILYQLLIIQIYLLINEIGPLFLKWKGKVYWGQNWQNQTLCCESKQARQI